MNTTWRAFRSIPLIVLALATGLLLTGLPILADYSDQLIPSPEGVAGQFVTAMGAHREAGALNTLTSDLQQQTKPDELRQIIESIEQKHGGIEDALGTESLEQGDQSTATVQVKLKDQQEIELEFPLVLENHEWKLASFEPIHQLAQ